MHMNKIDTAISTALKERKPAYINICCNLPSILHPTFNREPIPLMLSPRTFSISTTLIENNIFDRYRSSNKNELEAAVEATITFLNKASKPVLLGGPKLRVSKAYDAFVELVAACGYAFAVMESAKGMVPEHHPYFIGTYWGVASTAFCAQIVESADAYLFVGSVFNDYSTVGFSLPPIKKEKVVFVHPNRVVIANCANFGCVLMGDLLRMLAKKLKRNTSAYENHRKMYVSEGVSVKCEAGEPLKVNVLFQHRQRMLSHEIVVISEAGDSINNCQKLKLPEGCEMDTEPNIGVSFKLIGKSWCCRYEIQSQYTSIGWSVGATLGYAQAIPDKRAVACIGDGSFQVRAKRYFRLKQNLNMTSI
ncbi:hypothetical protein ACSBR1_033212 [Camellia fascicularis]